MSQQQGQPQTVVRVAHETDVPLILNFIHKLADYERLSNHVVADEESLRRWLFGARSVAEAVLAYRDASAVGFAVFFTTFSTFAGQPALYLEDLFVDCEHRGKGVGKALFAHIAQLAVEREYRAVVWAVLNWNQAAIDFYRNLGAIEEEDWRIYKLSGTALKSLAEAETFALE